MALDLSILYRGPLSSCNYGCAYCPFAKHAETAAELDADRRALERFTDWVSRRGDDRIPKWSRWRATNQPRGGHGRSNSSAKRAARDSGTRRIHRHGRKIRDDWWDADDF